MPQKIFLVSVIKLKQPSVEQIAFATSVGTAAFVAFVTVVTFAKTVVAEVKTLVVGSQGTLIEEACQIVMASKSFAELVRIVGTIARNLASTIVEVVVHQDQLELMLGYELEPCY